ncbi:MAG: histidine--tRNA ligase [Patescibacteria group bacterium]|nr:histidine--tRNA ligase [Patescibacteria group bacterium]
MAKNNINPELPSGFRDYLPQEMIARQKMLNIIEQTFQKFGFLPLDTPCLEREEILTGGDEDFKKQIYRAGLKDSNDKLALRFDLTVPLARVVASSQEQISLPFKRYQIGKVWRGERPQAGRFREFVQFDADIVGTKSMMADAEIIALMSEIMSNLGFKNFLIQINNRKILNGLSEYAGYEAEKNAEVIRILDKVDKIGWDDVKKLLSGKEIEEDEDKKLNLNDQQIQAIKNIIDINDKDSSNVLAKVKSLMKDSAIAQEGIAELEEIIGHLDALGVPKDKWVVDLSIARGLGYYTGPVYETILTDMIQLGSVFSGGRYDGLVNRFMANSIPATGASVGVDRLFVAVKEMKLIESPKTVSKVLVLDIEPSARQEAEKVLTLLRKNSIASEMYFGNEKTIKGQLSYGVCQDFPVIIIIGSDELKRGVIQIKNIKTREQFEVKEKDLVQKVKEIVG